MYVKFQYSTAETGTQAGIQLMLHTPTEGVLHIFTDVDTLAM